jgi:hypothetical protein
MITGVGIAVMIPGRYPPRIAAHIVPMELKKIGIPVMMAKRLHATFSIVHMTITRVAVMAFVDSFAFLFP